MRNTAGWQLCSSWRGLHAVPDFNYQSTKSSVAQPAAFIISTNAKTAGEHLSCCWKAYDNYHKQLFFSPNLFHNISTLIGGIHFYFFYHVVGEYFLIWFHVIVYLNYAWIFPNTMKVRSLREICDCCHISIKKSKIHVCIKVEMDDKYAFRMGLNKPF